MNKIKLLSDRVLVELDGEESKTESGLIISKNKDQGEIRSGVIIAVGPGKITEQGNFIAIKVAVGNNVMLQYGQEIVLEGKAYVLVREEDIILVID